jgi:phosphoadenosine phosphosulfate reductase
MRFNHVQSDKLNKEFESESPEKVLKWTLDNLHPRVSFASSFGAEDVVVIDMLVKIDPDARIFTLDTGRLNQETYDLIDDVRRKY